MRPALLNAAIRARFLKAAFLSLPLQQHKRMTDKLLQCILNRCTHSQLFRSALNFWSTLVRTISASSMIGIVPIALHDGMIGGAAPAANESLRAGHSKTISDSAVKAVLAVARVIQRTAQTIVKNVTQSHACKWSTQSAVIKSRAREQQGHRCALDHP